MYDPQEGESSACGHWDHTQVGLNPITFPPPDTVPLEEVQLVVEPEGGAVALGGTVTLTCEAPAQPPPQIHWIKDVSDPRWGWQVARYIIGNSEGRGWEPGALSLPQSWRERQARRYMGV